MAVYCGIVVCADPGRGIPGPRYDRGYKTRYTQKVPFNALKDYEAWELHREYHHLRLSTDGREYRSSTTSNTNTNTTSVSVRDVALSVESSPLRLTPGTWYIGVANTAATVLASALARCVMRAPAK
eukprot:1177107-Prorocentrum_minimum.AAC.2